MSKRYHDDTSSPYDGDDTDHPLFSSRENGMMNALELQWLMPDSDNLDFLRPRSPLSLNPTDEHNHVSSQNEPEGEDGMLHEFDKVDEYYSGINDDNGIWSMISNQYSEFDCAIDENAHVILQNEPESEGEMLHEPEDYDCRDTTPSIMAPTDDKIRPYLRPTRKTDFSDPINSTRHMSTHTMEKTYVCETCDKAFLAPNNLKIHMRVHTGEKPYVCKTCGKSFSVSWNLTSHMRTHTGEKPHVCEMCGKAFTQYCHLVTHVRTHTGEKPFVCEECGKAFADSCNLTVHMRTHLKKKSRVGGAYGNVLSNFGKQEGKPHVCETCGKAFHFPSDLVRHVRTHNKP